MILAVLCVIGFWQISFGFHPLKWDVIDYYFPSRFILGEMFQNQSLPLWNPYQTLGYPIHADPQSGAWYPLAWIIGYFKGYTLNSIGFEFLLHIFIGSCGVFALGKTLKYDKSISLILAVAYMFSGFFVGNAQHLTWTISGAWLPWIFNQFIVLHQRQSIYNSALLALLTYLFVSAGYPAFVFVTFYFLIFLTIFFTVNEYKTNKIKGVFRYYKYLIVTMIIVLVCSSIILVSNYYVLPYLTRGSGVSQNMALFSPFSPLCSLSFLAPFSVVGNHSFDIFNTDLSMTNGYFGIIIFIFAILGFWLRKKPIHWFFIVFAIFSLLASFGAYTPVRLFLYDYIPLMNTFRFPSLFRLFFILFFILIAGNAMQNIFINNKKMPLSAFLIAGFLIGIMIVLIVIFRGQDYLNIKNVITQQLFNFSTESNYKQHFAVHSLFQIIVLLLTIFLFYRFQTSRKSILLTTTLLVAEMMFSAQINAPYTIYDKQVKTKDAQDYLNAFPKNYPTPNNHPIIHNEKDIPKQIPFWRNTSMYNKQVSHEGFTPFIFKDFKYLTDTIPEFFNKMLQNPLIFISNSIYSQSDFSELSRKDLLDSSVIFLTPKDYALFENFRIDSLKSEYKITKFSPTIIEIECKTDQQAFLVLQQNYYYGWIATVNNKVTSIYNANYTTMAVSLEKGDNSIVFQYHPKNIIVAYYMSIISFFTLLFSVIIGGVVKIMNKQKFQEND